MVKVKPPDFLHQVIEAGYAAGQVSEAAAHALEARLRKEFGGRRVYIPKTVPTDRSESPRRVSTGAGEGV